jgi:hypothetical protein
MSSPTKDIPLTPEFIFTPVGKEPIVLFDLADRANLSLKALGELGITFPDPDLALEHYVQQYTSFHDQLVNAGDGEANANPEPFLGITLDDDTLTLSALIARYDEREGQTPTSVDHDIWDKLTAAQLNSRRIDESTEGTQDQANTGLRVLAMLRGGKEGLDDGGLYYTDMHDKTDDNDNGNGSQQVEAAESDLLLNPADNIVLNVQRRVAGQKLLSSVGWHRFVQIDNHSADGVLWRPSGFAGGGQPEFNRSIGNAGPGTGVRRLVEKKA